MLSAKVHYSPQRTAVRQLQIEFSLWCEPRAAPEVSLEFGDVIGDSAAPTVPVESLDQNDDEIYEKMYHRTAQ